MRQSLAPSIALVMPAARLTGLFVSLITFQAPFGYTSTGEPSGNYTDVPGLVNLPCQSAPEAVDRFTITAKESHAVPEIQSDAVHHVLLDNYYPALSPATNWGDTGWRAIVDGVIYDVQGVENDSQFTQQRICLHKVTT